MLLLLISSTASFLSIRSLLDSNWWVNHTNEVIYNINSGQAELIEAQTSVRGYLLTGKLEYLDQYTNSDKKTELYFEKLASLTSDNQRQQNNINILLPLKDQFFDYLKERVANKSFNKDLMAEDLSRGKALMDKLRTILKSMVNEEQRLLVIREGKSKDYGNFSLILIVIAAIIALFVSIYSFIRILKDFNARVFLNRKLQANEQETVRRIAAISRISSQISQGNYHIRIDESQSDELGTVAVSLNSMAESLERSFKKLSDKEWLQTGLAELNKVMITERDLGKLTQHVLEYVASYTGSGAGALYLTQQDTLHFSAGYSYLPNSNQYSIKAGEGLTGQAFVSGRTMELQSVPAENITISYALGDLIPSHITAVPLVDVKVIGVMELAALKAFSGRELEFLEMASHNIAIAVSTAQSRQKIQELLEETQSQSEELMAQHTELEGINAELEAQSEKLQASEEELRVQQEELQQSNTELTSRGILLEQKNEEIQKKSEDLALSTRYKSEFLANMSHELRTPLNSILLLSRLLRENNDKNMNDEQVEFATVIQNSGSDLLSLIDEILDLSKIESGKMELEFSDIQVQEIAQGMRNLFTAVAKEKGIGLSIVVETGTPQIIRTDQMRLEQVLKNLLSNALKFTAEGTVTLTIKKNPSEDSEIVFAVKDTGIGIPPSKQAAIFEAFQQADGSTKRKYGGTGLGLSISREIAKLLQGEITLVSQIDKGSEFTLHLPSKAGSTEPAFEILSEDSAAPFRRPAQDTAFLSTFIPEDVSDDRKEIKADDKVMLIVEDDVNFAKSLLEFTRNRGYKGIVAVRGDQALDLAMKYKPTGILLDVELPVKSGWAVMEELKGAWQTKHIPVHIMSSHKVKQESLLRGAVKFLDKPIAYEQMPEIFKRIEDIVHNESKKVLIIEDNPKHARALAHFLENYEIHSEIQSQIEDGLQALQKKDINCVILDMGVPQEMAYSHLENVKKNAGMENLPIIVFTGNSLSISEEAKIKKYADSIVVKTANSYQRMLDEVSLFLHIVESEQTASGRKENYQKRQLENNVLTDKTVLVVDDDVRNIYSLTKSLEVLKMNVVTAIDGNEALKALEEHPEIDVVLLDMMMPNLDGYETAKKIREQKKLTTLPVIAVTAKAMKGDREKCIDAGASDYITKPVDSDQLISLLRAWLYDKI